MKLNAQKQNQEFKNTGTACGYHEQRKILHAISVSCLRVVDIAFPCQDFEEYHSGHDTFLSFHTPLCSYEDYHC